MEPRSLQLDAGDAAVDERDEMDENDNEPSPLASPLNDYNEEDPESSEDPSSNAYSSSEDNGDEDSGKKPEDKYASQNHACELSSMIISSVDKLPPLPQPRNDYFILEHENPRGSCVVFTGIVVCIFLTHYIALTLVLPSEDLDHEEIEIPYQHGKLALLALIYAESFGAILCAAGIVCANPCVVKRTEETCNPVPKKVEHWIQSGGPRPLGLEHYLRGADQRIYCTKCLVWRKPGVTHFHCAICQRCCAYHDHHCNVFGKCIAGNLKFWKGNAGNRLYFYGLLVSGAYGFITVFAAFLYAFSIRYQPAYALPIGVAVMLLISCCCFGNSPINIFLWPLFRCLRMTKKWFIRTNR